MTDSTKRSPREAETRAKTQRRKPWAPPSKLEAPEAPAGYKHRWIRTSLRGEDDQMNVTTKMREGWEPVRADEYPEMAEERTEYFREQTRTQMDAVDQNLMREQHPSMPIHSDRKSRVSFGGRKDGSD